MNNKNIQIATVGGGCFWCTEAVFQEVKGVEKVVSGYTRGDVPGRPTYREICSGLTGAAEVIQITFDENIISFEDILVVFMTTHNPTTLIDKVLIGAHNIVQLFAIIIPYNKKSLKK